VAGRPDDPFVAGGGRLGPGTFPSGFTIPARDFSVDAHVKKQGENVYGFLTTGRNGIGSVQTDVTCVSIDGNRAVVGGIKRTTGGGRVVFLIDNGPPSSTVRDQSSAWFVDPLDAEGWPDGFPYVCPTPDSAINGTGYLDIHSGDIVVSAGSD
jgi:hypothetical protein